MCITTLANPEGSRNSLADQRPEALIAFKKAEEEQDEVDEDGVDEEGDGRPWGPDRREGDIRPEQCLQDGGVEG